MAYKGSQPDFARIRQQFPALQNCVYLNCGTYGIMPRRVFEAHSSAYEQILTRGLGLLDLFPAMRERVASARESLARLLCVNAESLAFLHNTSEGLNVLAWGLDLGEGDRVLITSDEHESFQWIWRWRAQRIGLALDVIPFHPDPERFMAEFTAKLSVDTKLVAISHVSCLSGAVAPVEDICRASHGCEIPVLVDGAQSVGQVPVDLGRIGCDYYVGCGHKWLCGPLATGFLYVSAQALRPIEVTYTGWDAEEPHPPWEEFTYKHSPAARRFEYGTSSYADIIGLAEAVEHTRKIGLEAIQSRCRSLSKRLREGLAQIPKVTLYNAGPIEWSSGMTTFTMEGETSETLLKYLWQHDRVSVRPVPELRAIRISAAFFNNEEDIDHLLKAIEKRALSG